MNLTHPETGCLTDNKPTSRTLLSCRLVACQLTPASRVAYFKSCITFSQIPISFMLHSFLFYN